MTLLRSPLLVVLLGLLFDSLLLLGDMKHTLRMGKLLLALLCFFKSNVTDVNGGVRDNR